MTAPALRGAAAAAGSLAAWLLAAATALADSPAPSQAAIGDPRGGQAAGFAGNPGFAILMVALIAVVAVVATMAWVRATGGRAAADGVGARGPGDTPEGPAAR